MDDKKENVQHVERFESVVDSDSSHSIRRFDQQETKRLLRKIDWVLLPFISLLYLYLTSLNNTRTNIGNARLSDLEVDLQMEGLQFNLALAAFFIPYALVEIPSNYMMKIMPPSIWIPTIMVGWGIVCTCMGLVKDFTGLAVARAFLGLTEGGLFPGISFFITQWYCKHECALRLSIFFSAATIAGGFGGLFARVLTMLNGKLGHPGWAWIFIVEGALTIVVALSAYKAMQDYPATAKFLTEQERAEVAARLAEDRDYLTESNDKKFVWAAITDWKTYVYSAMGICSAVPVYSLSLFMPTIIASLGFKNATAQLMTVPVYTLACMFTITGGFLADKFKQRGVFIIGFTMVAITGFIILMNAKGDSVKYFGCCVIACGIFPTVPQAIAWASNNVGGSTKKSITIATFVMFSNAGAVTSSFIYLPAAAPKYTSGHSILLGANAMTCIIATFLTTWFRRENARRDAIKPAAMYTKDEKLLDSEMGENARFFRFTI
ncbi:MFS general substrate transporter [Microthyrium microscopicum]|uniref:MFS general substrate transporter n=1 Tax=Microthyrium microscopicum TaxID=703497 RepID=A0A6A6U7W1_9PEZI|nr:MFS general substrate transporter [Microthyrium microscopicum]